MITDIEGLCRKLKPIIGIKADELWYMWLSSDLQERKNLEIEIQIIAEKALKHGPLQDKVILLPPPEEEQAKGDFILGKVIYRDKKLFPIYLKDEDFVKQVGIFSITGGGKTNAAMLLAVQLLKNEGGKSPIPFMIIDWKRQWRSMLSLENFPEMKDVRVYTIGRDVIPFLWNPFRPPPNIDYKTWISVIIECLEKSHLAGPGVGDFIIRIYEKLFKEIDIKKEDFYPNFHDGLRELSEIKVGGREFLWWQSTKRIFNNFIFGPASKSFNTRNPIKLEELLEKPVILELDQEMPKPLRIFFMEMIIRFIHLYRLGQGDSDNALRHVLFLEEIHNLFQKTSYEKDRLAAIYLSEYSKDNLLTRLIKLAIVNLAGVPSVVYGLFGLALFVVFFKFGASILSGSLTLGIMILPVIITTSREALESVPYSFREVSLSLGASKWQTIRHIVLPNAIPGILTGTILGLGRAAGETAPILFTVAAFYLPRLPNSIFDQAMALPYHLYVISTQVPNVDEKIRYGTAFVLLALVLVMNLVAIIIRYKFRKKKKW